MKPPKSAFAAAARGLLELHDWDTPPWFAELHWDGRVITFGVNVLLGFHPDQYPAVLIHRSKEAVEKQLEKNQRTLYGFAIMSEGYSVVSLPDASEEERRRFRRDRANRTFHQRPDAVENVFVYCADIYGQVWSATEARNVPEAIGEDYFPADRADVIVGGQLVTSLRAVAIAAGHFVHGLPAPRPS